MKRLLFSLAALFFLSASASAQMKPIDVAITTGEEAPTHYYHLYDQAGFLVYAFTPGVGAETYTNDEMGHPIQKDVISYLDNTTDTYQYTYNAQGLVATMTDPYGAIEVYEYDSHGKNTKTTVTRKNGSVFVKTTTNSYDADDNLIHSVIMGRSEIFYTYENGLLVREQTGEVNGAIQSITTYTYNLDGSLATARTEIPESTETTSVYSYADIDVSYIPQNAFAVANVDNTVTLTWSGTATAVVVDGQLYPVSGNSFTTPVMQDGLYTFYVVNNGNAAVLPDVSVYDASKVGVSNVHMTGDIYATNETIIDIYGEPKDVIAYNLPIAWELNSNRNPSCYRIYYNSTYYVDVEDGALRSYIVPAVNMTVVSSTTYSKILLPLEIRVVAIYTTGQEEPANTIDFTLEQTEDIMKLVPLGINTPQLSTLNPHPSTSYDLSGRPAASNTRGILIQRQGDRVLKVLKR